MERTDVFIAGAGPTGLVLALALARQGVRVTIVDRSAQPGTTSRALAVQARTLELYRALGLTEDVLAAGMPNPGANLWVAGQRKAHISFGEAAAGLTPYPFLLIYPQDRHERLLSAHLERAGVRVQRATEVLGFEERDDHVLVRLRHADGSTSEQAARYLAGCDGAHSLVRQRLGSGFPGGTYDHLFYVADVLVEGALADGQIHIALDHADFLALFSYSTDGHARLIGTVRDARADAPGELGFDDVKHDAIGALGLRIKEVHWFSTYHVHHRVTEHYRRGRAFLLGDAAHIHSPAGGQGMNTGIGDAINLAWKLAAVLRGEAPDALLDSYGAERRAFAEQLVQTTDRAFTFATRDGTLADFVRTRIAPLVIGIGYRIDKVQELLFRVVSQTTIHYPDSPLSSGHAGAVRGGDRLPWTGSGGSDNYASLAAGGWQVHVYGSATAELTEWCAHVGLALHRYAWNGACARAGLARDAAYLLRPDGYVACADPHARAGTLQAYFGARGFTRFGR